MVLGGGDRAAGLKIARAKAAGASSSREAKEGRDGKASGSSKPAKAFELRGGQCNSPTQY
jgi:hypothetical protein